MMVLRNNKEEISMEQMKIVIAGAGIMGASLAQVYGQGGWNTVVYNRSESGLERCRELVALNQKSLVLEEMVTAEESAALLANISYTCDKSCMADCDVLLETIVEDMDAKHAFLEEASRIVPETALVATNTSGMSITEIAKAVYLPERFMGQHWLNPPHLIPLCEITCGEKTDPACAEKMYQQVKALGKRPVLVKKDVTGFIVNRLQYACLREALSLVENGVADVEDIDTVFKSGVGLRFAAIGFFRMFDFGGLDTVNAINKYLNATLDNNPEGSALLDKMVTEGRCGVKTGSGFYEYPGDTASKMIQKRDELYITLAKILFKE